MKSIYVGNLDFATTEDQIRTLFEPFGKVEMVTLVKDRDTGNSRGFAFVEMTSDIEADTAMKALDKSLLGERPLNVNEARPRSNQSPRVQ